MGSISSSFLPTTCRESEGRNYSWGVGGCRHIGDPDVMFAMQLPLSSTSPSTTTFCTTAVCSEEGRCWCGPTDAPPLYVLGAQPLQSCSLYPAPAVSRSSAPCVAVLSFFLGALIAPRSLFSASAPSVRHEDTSLPRRPHDATRTSLCLGALTVPRGHLSASAPVVRHEDLFCRPRH